MPIDFGYSFGTGLLLSVPELVPFRLTNQLQGGLAPHDAKALLAPSMAAALAALRDNRAALRAVLQIFLNEPLMEWRREAARGGRRQAAAGGEMHSCYVVEFTSVLCAYFNFLDCCFVPLVSGHMACQKCCDNFDFMHMF